MNNYSKGEIEFDLVGEREDVVYIFEIKWRNRATGYKEVEKFLKKVELSEFASDDKKLFFISKAGFTDSAEKFAIGGGVALLNV